MVFTVAHATASDVQVRLHNALGASDLPAFRQCALLQYPDHINIGDHLIWLGNLMYLRDTLDYQPFARSYSVHTIGYSPHLFTQ